MLFCFCKGNAQEYFDLNSTYTGVQAKMKVLGVDPGGAQLYHLIINNYTNSELKIVLSYQVIDKCGGFSNGTKTVVLGPQKQTNDGGYTGSRQTKPCVQSGNSIKTVVLTSLNVEDLTEAKRIEQARKDKEKFEKEQIQIKKREEQERLKKIEQDRIEQEQKRLEEQNKEAERIEAEKNKEAEDKINQLKTVETKKIANDSNKKIAEQKLLAEQKTETQIKKSVPIKEKTQAEKDSDYKIYVYCLGQYNLVKQKIEYAKKVRTITAWQEAEKANNNYTCSGSVSRDYNWTKEIKDGLQVATIAKGGADLVGIFTGLPFTYGYGQFLNTKEETYIHRFLIGGADVYEGKMLQIKPSIMLSYMKLPADSINYKFNYTTQYEGDTRKEYTKSKLLENNEQFGISIGASLNFWPQRNIYFQINPEFTLALNSGDYPVSSANYFLGVNNKLGFRFGRIYLSATYGFLWTKYQLEEGYPYEAEFDIVNGSGGEWKIDNINNNKFKLRNFWLISLGCNFDF